VTRPLFLSPYFPTTIEVKLWKVAYRTINISYCQFTAVWKDEAKRRILAGRMSSTMCNKTSGTALYEFARDNVTNIKDESVMGLFGCRLRREC
jgi:hypothetical protein